MNINHFFGQADKGRSIWLELKLEMKIDENWYLIILPEKDDELNESAVRLLDEFLTRKYVDNAVVICGDYMEKNMLISTRKNIVYKKISEQEMNEIIQFYKLQQFFKNIVVISMNSPFGSRGVIGHLNISIEDYVKNALYV